MKQFRLTNLFSQSKANTASTLCDLAPENRVAGEQIYCKYNSFCFNPKSSALDMDHKLNFSYGSYYDGELKVHLLKSCFLGSLTISAMFYICHIRCHLIQRGGVVYLSSPAGEKFLPSTQNGISKILHSNVHILSLCKLCFGNSDNKIKDVRKSTYISTLVKLARCCKIL